MKLESRGSVSTYTIGTRLIPALSGRSYSAQTDGIPQHLGAMPLVVALILESTQLIVAEVGDGLELLRIAGDEGGSGEQVGMFGHAIRFGEDAGIVGGLLERVALRGREEVSANAGRMVKTRRSSELANLERILDDVEGDGCATAGTIHDIGVHRLRRFLLVVGGVCDVGGGLVVGHDGRSVAIGGGMAEVAAETDATAPTGWRR